MIAAEGSCQIPIAAHAVRDGDEIHLRAMLAEPDGSRPRWREVRAAWPTSHEAAAEIGRAVGQELRVG
jgi:hydroxymethylbilane synthase